MTKMPLVYSILLQVKTIAELGLPIEQLHIKDNILLISRYSRSSILDITNRKVIIDIGSKEKQTKTTKPLGCCFHPINSSLILDARRSKQVFETGLDGNVLRTLKFDATTPPKVLFETSEEKVEVLDFFHLECFGKYMISWGEGTFALIDPVSLNYQWYNDCGKVIDAAVYGTTLILLLQQGDKLPVVCKIILPEDKFKIQSEKLKDIIQLLPSPHVTSNKIVVNIDEINIEKSNDNEKDIVEVLKLIKSKDLNDIICDDFESSDEEETPDTELKGMNDVNIEVDIKDINQNVNGEDEESDEDLSATNVLNVDQPNSGNVIITPASSTPLESEIQLITESIDIENAEDEISHKKKCYIQCIESI